MSWFGKKAKKDGDGGPEVVLSVEGMHCGSCGLLIDDELEEVAGVREASTDVRAGRSVVQLTTEGIDHGLLIAAVERAGYKATVATVATG